MRQLFGGVLLAIGILVAGLSGLCTLFGIGTAVLQPGSGSEMGGLLPLVLIVGGLPFALGVGLIFAGRALLRDRPLASVPLANSFEPAPLDPATMAQPREPNEGPQ